VGTTHLDDVIALDAPTRPSDSGGAIVDENYKVVAMTTAAPAGQRFRQQTSATTTFAVPINTVVAIADRIDGGRSGGTVHVGPTATLGLAVSANGVVTSVEPASPAARAGITPRAVIAGIDNATIADQAGLNAALSPYAPGDRVRVDWAAPGGTFHSTDVALGAGSPV
jgi:S1-C subfamily serine protease